MTAMGIFCGGVPEEARKERDVVGYALPGRSGSWIVCTECLEAPSGARGFKSLTTPALADGNLEESSQSVFGVLKKSHLLAAVGSHG
jgi:hypothetical protein